MSTTSTTSTTMNLNYTPTVLCSTVNMSEEDWLKWRTTGIGGSDAGTVLGINPYRTARELYYDKRGVKPFIPKDSEKLPFRWGHALEPVVAEEFSRKTGLMIYETGEMYQHPLHPMMQANVDRIIEFPDGTLGILECKTASPDSKVKWENGKIPESYEWQVRHYLAVMNLNVAYIACLFENNSQTMAIQRIDRDLALEQQLIEAEENFWNNYVLAGVEPPLTEAPKLCLETIGDYRKVDTDETPVKLTGFEDTITEYNRLKAEKKALDDKVKELEKQIDALIVPIVDEMGDKVFAESSDSEGNIYTISYKPSSRIGINKENLTKLKFAHEDIYNQYVTETTSHRFTVKAKKK